MLGILAIYLFYRHLIFLFLIVDIVRNQGPKLLNFLTRQATIPIWFVTWIVIFITLSVLLLVDDTGKPEIGPILEIAFAFVASIICVPFAFIYFIMIKASGVMLSGIRQRYFSLNSETWKETTVYTVLAWVALLGFLYIADKNDWLVSTSI